MANNSNNLKNIAYNLIKEKIIKLELEPGEDISEKRVIEEAEKMNLSLGRTPVREALLMLEQDRFVNIYPRKGIFVSNISIKLINDVFHIRELIEPQIIRNSVGKLDAEWLKQIKAEFTKSDLSALSFWHYTELDREFHMDLIKTADNKLLEKMMANILEHDQRIRILSSRNPERLAASNVEHVGIINALLEGNRDQAEALSRKHIINARNAALKLDFSNSI